MIIALLIFAIIGWLAFALLVVVFRLTVNGLTAMVALQRERIARLEQRQQELLQDAEWWNQWRARRSQS